VNLMFLQPYVETRVYDPLRPSSMQIAAQIGLHYRHQ